MSHMFFSDGKHKNSNFYLYMRKVFRSRMRAHQRTVSEQIRISFPLWPKNMYAVIGIVIAIILFLFLMVNRNASMPSEVHQIYYSALIFLVVLQFSISYYLQPADLIFFHHKQKFMLKMRKYALIHALFNQMSNWLFLFLLLSPMFFSLFNDTLLHYISLYLFTVTYSLATSLIRKESMLNIKKKSRLCYLSVTGVSAVFLYAWFTMIFCFADQFFISIGTITNILIYIYAYNWGSKVMMQTLDDLVKYDNRTNIIKVTLVSYLEKYTKFDKLKGDRGPRRFELSVINEGIKSDFVLHKLMIKYLLQVRSYSIMMCYIIALNGLGLLLIENGYEYLVITCLTLVLSYFIHKHHLDYFCSQHLMRGYKGNRISDCGYHIKLTMLLTLPVIIVMSLFIFL